MAAPFHSGSRAKAESDAADGGAAAAVDQEWLAAEEIDRREARQAATAGTRRAVTRIVPAAIVAALLPAILPLTPGFSITDTLAAVIASAVAAGAAIGVVPLANQLGSSLVNAGAGDRLLFTAALASAGAAAIHFSVIKMHFDEYTLYGVFFVPSSIAQLVWPIWLLFRRWSPLLVLGALGNGVIAALWLVDRVGWVPIGPDATKPPPFAFGDTVTSGFEVFLVVLCTVALRRGRGRPLQRSTTVALTLFTAALTALASLSVLGVGSSFLTPTQ